MTQETSPRIYVACLAAYNAGHLHGAWIEADQDTDDLAAEIDEVLKTSPVTGAEEWAIHDFEGFGAFNVDEYESLEDVAKMANLIASKGAIVSAFVQAQGCGLDEAEAEFEERYCGAWESLTAFAEEYLSDCGMLDGLDESFRGTSTSSRMRAIWTSGRIATPTACTYSGLTSGRQLAGRLDFPRVLSVDIYRFPAL
ncbi:MAG: antirestriction protein ArdA [Proteobacteria bacterium]|nr:antirestriction protein ArdA [Pseudomonadota bacterium]